MLLQTVTEFITLRKNSQRIRTVCGEVSVSLLYSLQLVFPELVLIFCKCPFSVQCPLGDLRQPEDDS